MIRPLGGCLSVWQQRVGVQAFPYLRYLIGRSMSHTFYHEIPNGKRTRDLLLSALSVIALLLILACVLFVTMRSPLKDDIAWLLYVARRWMGGRELYVDVVEVNPPLIVWISTLPLQIAEWLGVGVQFVVIPVFATAVLACGLWAAILVTRQAGPLSRPAQIFAVIGSILLILPAADLGQREHLLVAAFLPYLVLFARSLEGRRSSAVTSIAAGILAAIGCALKPRYCAAFVALECVGLLWGLRPWRLMPFAAGATLGGYALLVAMVCPAYLARAVPMALALYGATDVSFGALVRDSAILLASELIAIGLLCLRGRRIGEYHLMLTLVVFAAACTVVCFIDGKDWFYHRLPATIATCLAVLLYISTDLYRFRRAGLVSSAFALLGIFLLFGSSIVHLEPGLEEAVQPRQTAVDRLEKIIRDQHVRSYVAFSEWIALGFPVVNDTGVTWASRFDSMWALKGEIWAGQQDPAVSREWPIARWVTHDFLAGCPEIAVVDTRETTKYISLLSAADPAFARAWSRYQPIAAFDGLVVFRRGRGGCLDVWVASEAYPPLKGH